MREDTEVILTVTRVLENLVVPYYLGGSWASGAYGPPRSTLDVDIIADLKSAHVTPLVAALAPSFYIDADMIREALQLHRSFNILHLTYFYKVDIFVPSNTPFKRIQMSRRKPHSIEQGLADQVYFCSPEDIILEKLAWYRLGGEISERQWLDVRGVLKVKQPTLDYDYLRRWAKVLGVADLLARSMDEAFGEG
jgi:hypothetical protein